MNKVVCICVKEKDIRVNSINAPGEPLPIDFLRNHVGNSDGKSYFECVYSAFPGMPQIVIVCDEEGKLKGQQQCLWTKFDDIVGNVLICSIKEINGEFDLCGMTGKEVEKVFAFLPNLIKIPFLVILGE